MNAVLFALYLLVPGWALMWAYCARRAEQRAPAGSRWPSAAASMLDPETQVRECVSSPATRPRVRNWLRRLAVPRTYLDDVAQDVLAAAVASASKYNPKLGPVARWLNGIAVNLAGHFRGKAWRRRERLVTAPGAPDRAPSPEAAFATEEERMLLREALARLPHEHAAVIAAHHLEELPMPEVAERFGLSVPTAYRRRDLGMAMLADLLRAEALGRR